MEKEQTLFETLLKLYLKLEDLKRDKENWEAVHTKLKEWKELPAVVASIYNYSVFAIEIKEILVEFFKADIEMTISKVQVEYDKEVRMNKSAWNSEFAGDFDKVERDLERKLTILKSFLNDPDSDK